MKTLITSLVAIFVSATLFAQTPIVSPTPKKPFEGFGGTALDQKAGNKPVNGVEIIKATYGAAGQQKAIVTSKIYKLVRDGNASSENKIQIPVTDDLFYYKNQGGTTYNSSISGNVSDNGNFVATATTTASADPVLEIVYRVNGVLKKVYGNRGDIIHFPQ